MNPEMIPTGDRDTELRRVLVATATASGYLRPRPSRGLVIGAILAFVLAGLSTGGAVASAATLTNDQSSIDTGLGAVVEQQASEQDASVLGSPIVRSGSETTVIQLGVKPVGATAIIIAFECIDTGMFATEFDGGFNSRQKCTRSDTLSPSAEFLPMGKRGGGRHTFTVLPPDSSRFAVWISWVKGANLAPSAAQKAELADGTITRTEYLAAYNRYAGCMAAAGFPMGDVDQSRAVINYYLSEDAVDSGADARCYAVELEQVDLRWQVQATETSYTAGILRGCLLDHSITPAKSRAEQDRQLAAHHLSLEACTSSE